MSITIDPFEGRRGETRLAGTLRGLRGRSPHAPRRGRRYLPLPRAGHASVTRGLDRRHGHGRQDGDDLSGQPRARGAADQWRGSALFSDRDGALEALIDFHLVTKWKTAGDSLFAATKLARPDSENHPYRRAPARWVDRSGRHIPRPFRRRAFSVWNRTRANAEAMAAECPGLRVADDLERAVADADIVTSATMTTEPILKGEWLRPGQHIDLIGAFRPDMREADDTALRRARIFVDSYDTTVGHIGEIRIPLEAGTIARDDLVADYYDAGTLRAPVGRGNHPVQERRRGASGSDDRVATSSMPGRVAGDLGPCRGPRGGRGPRRFFARPCAGGSTPMPAGRPPVPSSNCHAGSRIIAGWVPMTGRSSFVFTG